MLTQSRTYRWARVSHTSRNLQLDIGLYFLGHLAFLKWVIAPVKGSPLFNTFQAPFGAMKTKGAKL
ncbi:hypothetical protein BN1221_01264 [Brenneria goodwinii]|uniref:Uncharacterized protein n=1 Tax=Brenneria goodwinii TaxID=1109412 RepID=A0A0G4JSC4_9GAMM|nr:hypothetical protein BN1221_01264 [Brenneria goodwinii]